MILILGYFGRKNYGDDLFEYVWKKYFSVYHPLENVIIKNPNDVLSSIPKIDIIICGGGDLLNGYFIERFERIFKMPQCSGAKKYALGIGTPYTNLLPYLNMFDVVIHRDSDSSCSSFLNKNDERELPDLASILLTMENPNILRLEPARRKIGVFLAEPVFKDLKGKDIQSILELLKYLIERDKFDICLYPCGTGDISENDNVINRKVYKYLKPFDRSDVLTIYEHQPPLENAINWFKQFYMTICTRFHAHILSIMANVPFISSSPNRKVKNVLKDNNLDDYLHEDLIISYKSIRNNYDEFFGKLFRVCSEWKGKWIPVLNDLIVNYHSVPSCEFDYKSLVEKNINDIQAIFSSDNSLSEQALFKEDNSSALFKEDKTSALFKADETSALFKADVISYVITGIKRSKYHYGLMEQIKGPSFNLIESIKWITNDWYMSSYKDHVSRLKIINKDDLTDYHRSGWGYVMHHISSIDINRSIIFDSFLDKTFGWESEFYRKINLLPYKEKWVGVFHHTPNEDYTENNLVNCLKNPLFAESLSHCAGIIVLSQYIGDWLQIQLLKLQFNIQILVIKHPTEFPDRKFDIARWKYNTKKKVIQIGAWLRNSYAIYDLPAAPGIQKYAIKGKDMDNYFIRDITSVTDKLYSISSSGSSNQDSMNSINIVDVICRARTNKYITGLIDSIVEKHKSVKVIKWMENDKYDELLSRNIVFINLVDASAVNTIIECIVRNTPILVNRLPAVVEYLGTRYPFYYDNLDHAYLLMNDYDMVENTFEYLQKMDKSDLKITHFIKKITKMLECAI